MKETIKIEPGDDNLKVKLSMSVSQLKAIHNLLIEQPEEMTGYKKTADYLASKLKESK